eukprot:8085772-Pyramimonas_sp.AAC.1
MRRQTQNLAWQTSPCDTSPDQIRSRGRASSSQSSVTQCAPVPALAPCAHSRARGSCELGRAEVEPRAIFKQHDNTKYVDTTRA